MPSALDIDPAGTLLVGAGLGTWDDRVVTLIPQVGGLSYSGSVTDPDGVAFDSQGATWSAGSSTIRHLGTLDGGGSDSVFHQTESGSNINDLLVDPTNDDFYVAYNNGRVARVDVSGTETVVIGSGDEASIALDAVGGLLYAIRRNTGVLLEADLATGVVTEVVTLSALIPGAVRTNRLVFGPDDLLYSTTYYTDPNRSTISRLDPADPTWLQEWVTGLQLSQDNADDVHWDAARGCMYWSAPLTGRIYRVCECEDDQQ